ncbi:MAG: prepilin-type N-terminal cleavage/methylation domain-containing protein [Patescibacteria group bacterium]
MSMVKIQQRGFTVIELMIATATFSVVLIVVLSALLAIGRLYYKGTTEARVQEVTRGALDRVTRSVQFSGVPIESGTLSSTNPAYSLASYYCFGGVWYVYSPGKQLRLDAVTDPSVESSYGIHVQRTSDCSSSSEPTDLNAAEELLGQDMHLVHFNILEDSGLVEASMRVAFGGDAATSGDLSEIFGYNSAIDNGNGYTDPAEIERCATNVSGSEFCAVSTLSSLVYRKVQ